MISPAADDGAWSNGSFLLEMKPRMELASLFISCPKSKLLDVDGQEPVGTLKMEDQTLELAFDALNMDGGGDDSSSDEQLSKCEGAESTQKLGAKLVDILLMPGTVCSVAWADVQQRLLMCKVKTEADYVSFAPKTIRRLEEELAQICHLREYVERIEQNKQFNVTCRQCNQLIHSHAKGEFEFGILPDDDWLNIAPQMDYFCGLSGSECCGAHLEHSVQTHNDGILGFATKFSADSMRSWLPGERKIVFSNFCILFRKSNGLLSKTLKELTVENLPTQIITCSNCNSHLGCTLKGHSDIFKLHLSVLHTYGDNQQKSAYISNRFRSMESYLAWMLLNKCEHHSSVKLIVRSLDRCPQLLIWLLEPYVLLTKGILRDLNDKKSSANSDSSNENPSISFPALKVLYKCFNSDDSKQDPRANGGDSSVGILEVPMGCCLQLTELLLSSSLALPPPLRALGQFYVGFIRLKDRVD